MVTASDVGDFPDFSPNMTPRVIPESDHPIRKKDIDKEALKVLYRLRDAGFSGYLVGGGVRDLYLGKKPRDFDISTDARPGQLRKLFRNSRTIGRRFRLVQVFFRGGKIIEVSTLRSLSEYDINGQDQVLPSNNTYGTLEEDAFRRDLTINSLFYEIENRTIIDYVGGVRDLDEGVVRIVGEPERRVTRDPVRIMRAVRHAARSNFEIEPITWKAIVANREKLLLCPPSRLRDELLKDLRSGASRPWAELAIKCGLLCTLLPCYEDIADNREVKGALLSMLGVLDRLYGQDIRGGRVVVPDFMLFALLLAPWACKRFDLPGQRVRGPVYHQLSRQIRSEIDTLFGQQLNMKRMIKEAITTLLVNISTFSQHHNGSSWPKWLRRKSYFGDCSRFYALYLEAMQGRPADEYLFVESGDIRPVTVEHRGDNGRERPRARKGINPAFTSRKHGVFGLRRG
ncbi:polya polymerase [Desulfolithobacter sp.]